MVLPRERYHENENVTRLPQKPLMGVAFPDSETNRRMACRDYITLRLCTFSRNRVLRTRDLTVSIHFREYGIRGGRGTAAEVLGPYPQY